MSGIVSCNIIVIKMLRKMSKIKTAIITNKELTVIMMMIVITIIVIITNVMIILSVLFLLLYKNK